MIKLHVPLEVGLASTLPCTTGSRDVSISLRIKCTKQLPQADSCSKMLVSYRQSLLETIDRPLKRRRACNFSVESRVESRVRKRSPFIISCVTLWVNQLTVKRLNVSPQVRTGSAKNIVITVEFLVTAICQNAPSIT